jgi:hypothetical protein
MQGDDLYDTARGALLSMSFEAIMIHENCGFLPRVNAW